MELFRFILGKHFNLRKDKRHPLKAALNCRVIRKSNGDGVFVDLLDISDKGMSFAFKKEKFEIGEKIQIVLSSDNDEQIHHEGEILSQHIFYPNKAEDLKHAVLRFSVKFEKEADADFKSKLENMIKPKKRAS